MEFKVIDMIIYINDRMLSRIWIDERIYLKHPDILECDVLDLIMLIDGNLYEVQQVKNGFEYYAVGGLEMYSKQYRLVFCLRPDEDYLGIVNCFRERNKK